MRTFDKTNSRVSTLLILGLMAVSQATWAGKGGNGGGKPGGGGSGPGDPVYMADSVNMGIDPLASNSVDNETTIRWRQSSLDLSGMVGAWSDGSGSCDHGELTGSFSIFPLEDGSARLTASFLSELGNGDIKGHTLTMEGQFVGDWAPVAGQATVVELYDWEISAETRKARRDDCDGSGVGTWSVTVELIP